MIPTVEPLKLSDRGRAIATNPFLTEEARARAFHVSVDELRAGINGRPTVKLIAGMVHASGLPIETLAHLTIKKKAA